jgi:transposase
MPPYPPRKELTDFQKGEIVGLRENYTHREIGRRLSIPHSTVSAFLNRLAKRNTHENLPRPGAPRKTSLSDDRYLVRSAQSNTRQPLAQLRVETNIDISEQTIRRRLKEAGIRKWRAVNRPLLSQKHAKQRLKWTQEHRSWSLEQWRKVIWSDETMTRNQNNSSQLRVFRRQTEREKYDPKNIQPKSSYGGASQMVWGCFIDNKLGPIVFVDQSINKEVYKTILTENLVPFIDVLINDGITNVVFQQDNASPHVAAATMQWLEDEAIKRGFSIMHWPSNSPDMNPIENLWAHLKRELHRQYPDTLYLKGSPNSIRSVLKERLHKIWWDIGPEVLGRLIESMPHRVQAVIDAKGWYTHY